MSHQLSWFYVHNNIIHLCMALASAWKHRHSEPWLTDKQTGGQTSLHTGLMPPLGVRWHFKQNCTLAAVSHANGDIRIFIYVTEGHQRWNVTNPRWGKGACSSFFFMKQELKCTTPSLGVLFAHILVTHFTFYAIHVIPLTTHCFAASSKAASKNNHGMNGFNRCCVNATAHSHWLPKEIH